jgi:ribonuclease D
MLDYKVQLVSNQTSLEAVCHALADSSAMALDIETINWWDRASEQIALMQLAWRDRHQVSDEMHVAVIDTLAPINLETLRTPLELSAIPKAIHNASYDAVRLSRHLQIQTSPIHDTMLAARRSGDRKCSLKAQAEKYLGLQLDKTEQRSDWSRRPLGHQQVKYAALDAACTLLLYERQITHGLSGNYEIKPLACSENRTFDFTDTLISDAPAPNEAAMAKLSESGIDLSPASVALLGIVTELRGRYSPEHLAVSVGSERVGLAGWIIDCVLGVDADLDEGSAKNELALLCESRMIQAGLTRRLEPTQAGATLWAKLKP